VIDPDLVAHALAGHVPVEHPALPGRTNHRRAGVLVPLRWRGEALHGIATLRPDALRRHGGEVSFPGGRPEPTDADLEATARREAAEELGLVDPRVVGRLSSMPLYTSDWRLEPFVAVLGDAPLRPSPDEVAAVLELDVVETLREGAVECIEAVRDGVLWQLPVFRTQGYVMYGATALTWFELLSVLAEATGRSLRLVPGALRFEDLMAHRARAGAVAAPPVG
jgi:8-oxo-dGTP pyrophosphatase MutT (NUDIX family)